MKNFLINTKGQITIKMSRENQEGKTREKLQSGLIIRKRKMKGERD